MDDELRRLRKEIGMIKWNGEHDKRIRLLESMSKKLYKKVGMEGEIEKQDTEASEATLRMREEMQKLQDE